MWQNVLHWHPPVGVFIAILALLGVVVPLIREKVGPGEKAVWTLVLFALLLLEIHSIYEDRSEHEREQADARKQQLDSFSKIAQGIDKTIENSDREFAATMRQTQAVLSNITGGDSFAVIEPWTFAGRRDMPLVIHNPGKNILTGVTVTVYSQGAFNMPGALDLYMRSVAERINVGTLHPAERLVLSAAIQSDQLQTWDDGVSHLFILIGAQNFTSQEYLQLRKGGEKKPWAYKYEVWRAGPKGPQAKLIESRWSDVKESKDKKR